MPCTAPCKGTRRMRHALYCTMQGNEADAPCLVLHHARERGRCAMPCTAPCKGTRPMCHAVYCTRIAARCDDLSDSHLTFDQPALDTIQPYDIVSAVQAFCAEHVYAGWDDDAHGTWAQHRNSSIIVPPITFLPLSASVTAFTSISDKGHHA